MTTKTHLILIFDSRKPGRHNTETGTFFRRQLLRNGYKRIKDSEGEYYTAAWSKPLNKEDLDREFKFIERVTTPGIILSSFLVTDEELATSVKEGLIHMGLED